MNFIEEFMAPTYIWDRGRNFDKEDASLHCKIIAAVLLSGIILDIYAVGIWFSKKGIYFNNRFLFEKIQDFLILFTVCFIFIRWATSTDKWEETFVENELSDAGFPFGLLFFFMLVFGFYATIESKVLFP